MIIWTSITLDQNITVTLLQCCGAEAGRAEIIFFINIYILEDEEKLISTSISGMVIKQFEVAIYGCSWSRK